MANRVLSSVSDDDDDVALSEEEPNVSQKPKEFGNILFKWTNYLHGKFFQSCFFSKIISHLSKNNLKGWQERYVILKDGVLSYYKSQSETQYGCRGAIALKESTIISHELGRKTF